MDLALALQEDNPYLALLALLMLLPLGSSSNSNSARPRPYRFVSCSFAELHGICPVAGYTDDLATWAAWLRDTATRTRFKHANLIKCGMPLLKLQRGGDLVPAHQHCQVCKFSLYSQWDLTMVCCCGCAKEQETARHCKSMSCLPLGSSRTLGSLKGSETVESSASSAC